MSAPRTIVVGVDGSPQGDAALAFALEEAARCGDTVEIVTSWRVDLPAWSYPVLPEVGTLPPPSELAAHAKEVQERALTRAGARPDVPVTRTVAEGLAGPVLVKAAEDARLLVVGSRAIGPVRAALLGSVSRYCAHHADCPVVVVPDPTHAEKGKAEEGEALASSRS